MFESAELGHKIDKATYDAEVPALREGLLNAQFDLAQKAKFPVIILVGGVDGAGKGETVNLLNAWMDPRHIQTHAMGEQSDEERERPAMWRFWRALPPKGKIGVFFGSWYTSPIVERVMGRTKTSELNQSIEEINRFETMLSNEGALVVKFWFHLSKDVQRKRLKSLEKDPKPRWRVTDLDWERFKLYDKFRRVSEHALRATSTAEAPWIVIEGTDPRYRSLTAGRILLEALRKRLTHTIQPAPANVPPPQAPIDSLNVFDKLDMTQKLAKKKFDAELEKYQGKLNLLTRDKRFRNLSVIALFEGSDAAGKGGAIRRITGALDARHYHIIPVAAPTEEERAQPYLWRFWRHIPRTGRVTIFDRSWYGRVLVERVEKFCSEGDWMRLQRDQRLRGATGQAQHRAGEILADHHQGRAVAPLQGTRKNRLQAFQDHRGRLAQSQEMERIRDRRVRHGGPRQHRDRAVDPGGGQRQELRAHQDPENAMPADRGCDEEMIPEMYI
jgi:polyphosphate:AMP phosphotransferase